MLNQIVLVGKLVKDVELEEKENGRKLANITIAIPRCFKNLQGEYETDFIDVLLQDNVAKNTADYCRKGDIIGVRGSLQSSTNEKEDGTKEFKIEVVADRVTFLTSKKSNED